MKKVSVKVQLGANIVSGSWNMDNKTHLHGYIKKKLFSLADHYPYQVKSVIPTSGDWILIVFENCQILFGLHWS